MMTGTNDIPAEAEPCEGCGAAGGGQLLQQVKTQVAPFFATLRLPLQAGIGMVCQRKFMFL